MKNSNNQSTWTKEKIRSIVSLTVWGFGLLYTLHSHFNGCPRIVILGGWLVGPPLWLLLEYHFFFDRAAVDKEFFLYTQSLQRNLWFGVATFLALKYLPLSIG